MAAVAAARCFTGDTADRSCGIKRNNYIRSQFSGAFHNGIHFPGLGNGLSQSDADSLVCPRNSFSQLYKNGFWSKAFNYRLELVAKTVKYVDFITLFQAHHLLYIF